MAFSPSISGLTPYQITLLNTATSSAVSNTLVLRDNSGGAFFTNIYTEDQVDVLLSGKVDTSSPNLLPSQTGNAGLFLTTDGSNPSWVAGGSSSAVWGAITGDITTQTDLQNQFGNYLPLSGGNMSGPIDMGTSYITNVDSFYLNNGQGTNSISLGEQTIYDAAAQPVIEWGDKKLQVYNGSLITMIDWSSTQNSSAALSFDNVGNAYFQTNISAANLSGTNTGDQDLSGYLPLSGGYMTGDIIFPDYKIVGQPGDYVANFYSRQLLTVDSYAPIDWSGNQNNSSAISFDSVNNNVYITGTLLNTADFGYYESNGSIIYDASSVPAIDPTNRQLIATSGTTLAIDWSQTGYNSNAFLSWDGTGIIYLNGTIHSPNDTYESVDTRSRQLFNATGSAIIDWSGNGNNTSVLSFNGFNLVFGTAALIQSSNNNGSIDPNVRQLIGSDGSQITVDWSGTQNNSAALSFDNSNTTFLAGDLEFQPTHKILVDGMSGGTISIYPDERTLIASDGSTVTCDWSGTQNVGAAISFASGETYIGQDIIVAGSVGVGATINDASGNTSLDPTNRQVISSDGSYVIFDYTNTGLNTGANISFSPSNTYITGSLTASVAYTPADSSKWSGNPTTIQEAIDRIAAVVGLTIPIP